MFYFVRHGEPDYSERNTKIYRDFGVNLAPLTESGIWKAKETAKDIRLQNADVIVSSPYTRALQTAAILSKELRVEIRVETDLHEWLANKDYIYESDETANQSYQEYSRNSGAYPQGEEQIWESSAMMKERAFNALEKYRTYDKVIVVCHGMLIQAVSGGEHPGFGEIVEYR
ncbi:histidine phosphatase family protein [Bariatricus sp. SGI.154]|uniref:histidine phosphatase family protein n=1 Tax=Bariatricus sp. SGI.154 TaxID=3420549 RepID=UPI003D074293